MQRRVAEGAAMLRTKGEAGTGNVVEAVRHARAVHKEIRMVASMDEDELFVFAKQIQAPFSLVQEVAKNGRLPVVNFAAGGIATPADAALMMQLGVDGVFVGSGIFKSAHAAERAKAIVQATTHYKDAKVRKSIDAKFRTLVMAAAARTVKGRKETARHPIHPYLLAKLILACYVRFYRCPRARRVLRRVTTVPLVDFYFVSSQKPRPYAQKM
ncbi:unnamed protein product [Ectocarpus sp. 13 AM-2016]